MVRLGKAALLAVPLSIGSGLLLGETTVSAMQVRRTSGATIEVQEAQIDLGRLWARAHRPAGADACPGPTLLFQIGCVSFTAS